MVLIIFIRYFSSITFLPSNILKKSDITNKTTILCMLHPANTITTNRNRFTARLLYASMILLFFFLQYLITHHTFTYRRVIQIGNIFHTFYFTLSTQVSQQNFRSLRINKQALTVIFCTFFHFTFYLTQFFPRNNSITFYNRILFQI